ncbi:MAG: hypothetical protein LUC50_05215 [Ruminococcus sp.]|nr:hypothetical protein [Ruminococcus sp.]
MPFADATFYFTGFDKDLSIDEITKNRGDVSADSYKGDIGRRKGARTVDY